MIIPNIPKLSDAQLAEVQSIVAEFGCRIQVIHGAHRNIYAIIGDERSELMVNRLEGLTYVDRIDRMESTYKLMDVRSDLANHRMTIGSWTQGRGEPFLCAGHCTIDPKEPQLFHETADALKQAGVHALRGGVWKPRTNPHSYQGDPRALDILLEARKRTGLPVVMEVMDSEHLKAALDAEVDVLQIGTRNALNYSLLREVGEKTAGTRTSVLLKRSRHMAGLDEFICAGEYIVAGGNPNLMLCPRGTMPKLEGYRNHPDESITPLLKQKTWAPVVVDPSHSVGRAQYVPACALAAIAYGADGLIIESHINPIKGIGDDPAQAITPDKMATLIHAIRDFFPVLI